MNIELILKHLLMIMLIEYGNSYMKFSFRSEGKPLPTSPLPKGRALQGKVTFRQRLYNGQVPVQARYAVVGQLLFNPLYAGRFFAVISWTSPFVILGESGLFCRRFCSIFHGKFCKQPM